MPNTRYVLSYLLLLPAMLLTGCEEPPPEEPIRPVLAFKVGEVEGLQRDRFPGRAKAKDETNLSFRVQGPLVARPVNVGDEVKKGNLIAQIDPTDYKVALENMRGQLDKSKADFVFARGELKRAKEIFRKDPGAVSDTYVDNRQRDQDATIAEIRTLNAKVQQAKLALSYTRLKAPFDGTIVATYVENHEYVRAQQPIARLLDQSRVEMVINVPEGLIDRALHVERLVVVFDTYPDVELEAKIFEIGKEATETTRTFPVTLTMEQPKNVTILPGMAGMATGYVRLPDNPGEGVNVPSHAVVSDQSGKAYVWVLKPETEPLAEGSTVGVKAVAERREVQVAKITGAGIRVASGLKSGEWIAMAGLNTLRDGQEVFLQPTYGEKR